MSDKRYLKLEGKKAGPFSLQQMMRMTELGEIDQSSEFWATRSKSWEPLTKMLWDFEPCRVHEMEQAGIQWVEVLGWGGGKDCPACAILDGKVFPIKQRPELPPADCTCLPWCACLFVARAT
jgi:hypothetical protein